MGQKLEAASRRHLNIAPFIISGRKLRLAASEYASMSNHISVLLPVVHWLLSGNFPSSSHLIRPVGLHGKLQVSQVS